MLLKRLITVGIAIGIKRHPHFIAGWLPRCCGRRWRRLFMRRSPRSDELLPRRDVRRELACGILFLKRLQLSFQLPQREGQAQLRRNEKRLDKKDGGNENSDAAKKEHEAKARPTAARRIGKNKRGAFVGKISIHEALGALTLPANRENSRKRESYLARSGGFQPPSAPAGAAKSGTVL